MRIVGGITSIFPYWCSWCQHNKVCRYTIGIIEGDTLWRDAHNHLKMVLVIREVLYMVRVECEDALELLCNENGDMNLGVRECNCGQRAIDPNRQRGCR